MDQNSKASPGKHLLLLEKVLLGRSISIHQNAIAPLGSTFAFNVMKIHWGPPEVHAQQAGGLLKFRTSAWAEGPSHQPLCRSGEWALCNE